MCTRNKRAVITDISASDDQTPASNHNDIEILTNEMDDFNGLGGTVAVMEVDEDELEAALNAPPQYTNSMLPSTQAKLMRVMGTPGACKTRRTTLHACMHQPFNAFTLSTMPCVTARKLRCTRVPALGQAHPVYV